MPLTMQADELAPRDQNVVGRSALARAPDGAGGDRTADTLDHVAKVAGGEFGLEGRGIERHGVGGNVDQDRLEPLGVGMAELKLAELLEVVVQQPGMVERRLQD